MLLCGFGGLAELSDGGGDQTVQAHYEEYEVDM